MSFPFPRSFFSDPFDSWFDQGFGSFRPHFRSDPFEELHRAIDAQVRRAARLKKRQARKEAQSLAQPSEAEVKLDLAHHKDSVAKLDSQEEETSRAWREYHEEMQRSMVGEFSTAEEKAVANAWDEYHQEMDRAKAVIEPHQQDLMDSFFRAPRVHVVPREDCYILVADVPGCRKEDVKVQFNHDTKGNYITIQGERKAETESGDAHSNNFLHRSIYGSFTRVVRLPANVVADPARLTAKFENGSLRIQMPKVSNAPKPQSVNIPFK
jgi:HSP20 family protein